MPSVRRASHLRFNSHVGNQKPESIHNRQAACPFCDREALRDVLDTRGPMIFLKNAFPVLEPAFQTVLIETDACEAEFSTYSREHARAVIRFGYEKWRELEASGEYASVIFYKNHGPYSGGSLRHPHMQIIGLHELDYAANVRPEEFEGLPIFARPGLTLNVSTHPRIGFFEFNALAEEPEAPGALDALADVVQDAAHYVMHHFHKACTSYNLFFYRLEGGRVAVKIVPRFVTTPLFVGYSIPQVSNRLEEVVEEIRRLYYAPAITPQA
jgi:galactose-1-phosphate uridylyltransferase